MKSFGRVLFALLLVMFLAAAAHAIPSAIQVIALEDPCHLIVTAHPVTGDLVASCYQSCPNGADACLIDSESSSIGPWTRYRCECDGNTVSLCEAFVDIHDDDHTLMGQGCSTNTCSKGCKVNTNGLPPNPGNSVDVCVCPD